MAASSSLARQVSALHARHVELASLTGRSAPALGPPASAAALREVEARLGPLPSVLRALLEVADGMSDFAAIDGLRIFSCGELVAPEYATFVGRVRARHGFKKETALQTGLVFGGEDDQVLVISEGPQKGRLTGMRAIDGARVTHFCLRPPGIVATGTLEQVLEAHLRSVEQRLADARGRAEEGPAARIDEAIAAFNHPAEMGEDVHDSVEAVREILADLPRSDPARPALERLLAELSAGYGGAMRFTRARRRDESIEVHYEGRWTLVTKIPR